VHFSHLNAFERFLLCFEESMMFTVRCADGSDDLQESGVWNAEEVQRCRETEATGQREGVGAGIVRLIVLVLLAHYCIQTW